MIVYLNDYFIVLNILDLFEIMYTKTNFNIKNYNIVCFMKYVHKTWWQFKKIFFPLLRYLGTENGFFKIFPGTMLSDVQYDPRDDLWYRKSYDNPDKYMFIDEGENSTYVTMAKVFHKTR